MIVPGGISNQSFDTQPIRQSKGQPSSGFNELLMQQQANTEYSKKDLKIKATKERHTDSEAASTSREINRRDDDRKASNVGGGRDGKNVSSDKKDESNRLATNNDGDKTSRENERTSETSFDHSEGQPIENESKNESKNESNLEGELAKQDEQNRQANASQLSGSEQAILQVNHAAQLGLQANQAAEKVSSQKQTNDINAANDANVAGSKVANQAATNQAANGQAAEKASQQAVEVDASQNKKASDAQLAEKAAIKGDVAGRTAGGALQTQNNTQGSSAAMHLNRLSPQGAVAHLGAALSASASVAQEAQTLTSQNEPQANNAANVARVAKALQGALKQNGGVVRIRMMPPELGVVRVEVNIHQGVVTAQFKTETSAVQTLLEHQLGQLRHTLESQGLTVNRLEVHQRDQNQPQALHQQDQQNQQSTSDGRSRGQYAQDDQAKQQANQQNESTENNNFEFTLNEVA